MSALENSGVRALAGRSRAQGADALRVLRFLKERSRHRARRDDVYISSYPRSGTTWTQLMVHLVRGGDLSFGHISDAVPWFERPLALGRATAATFADRRGPRSFKSHLPLAWLPRGARYVYVERDGRDVLVSYYHFYRSHLAGTDSFEQFFERFMRGELQYGSWFRHVAEYRRAAARKDVLLLRYEEIQSDPERAVRRIAAFLAVALSSSRLDQIVHLASFESMKQHEHKFDHAAAEPASAVAPGAFVREGRVGSHCEILSPMQCTRFERAACAMPSYTLPPLRLASFLH